MTLQTPSLMSGQESLSMTVQTPNLMSRVGQKSLTNVSSKWSVF